jgi:hypothetical protein
MNEYITLADFKRYQGIDVDQLAQDWLLRTMIEGASRSWDAWTRRRFYPRIETRYYDYRYSHELWLDDDLLEVTTFKTNNGGTTIDAADYWPRAGKSYSNTPYSHIVLKTTTSTPLTYSSTAQRANEVTGVWGYHAGWASAWNQASTLAASITASATTITVAEAGGQDWQGRSGRFEPTILLKLEAEYMYLVAIDEGTDTLTVVRGVNGSTATTHDKDKPVYTFWVDPSIQVAVRRVTAWFWHQKDSGSFATTGFPEIGLVEVPAELPAGLKALVDRYKPKRW